MNAVEQTSTVPVNGSVNARRASNVVVMMVTALAQDNNIHAHYVRPRQLLSVKHSNAERGRVCDTTITTALSKHRVIHAVARRSRHGKRVPRERGESIDAFKRPLAVLEHPVQRLVCGDVTHSRRFYSR